MPAVNLTTWVVLPSLFVPLRLQLYVTSRVYVFTSNYREEKNLNPFFWAAQLPSRIALGSKVR